MEKPPEIMSEHELIKEEFKKQIQELDSKMNEFGQKIVQILDKKSLAKSDKNEIIQHLKMLHREVGSNFPYVLETFKESTEEIVKEAKAVVDAFVTSTIVNAGIKSIQDNNGIVSMPKLENKD